MKALLPVRVTDANIRTELAAVASAFHGFDQLPVALCLVISIAKHVSDAKFTAAERI